MKKIVVFILVGFTAGIVFSQEFTFRGFNWGSSVENIIAVEGQPDNNWQHTLTYRNKTIAGYNATLFLFLDDGLTAGRYLFDAVDVSVNNSDFLFNDLLEKLIIMYGFPIADPELPYDKRYFWVIARTKITLIRIIFQNEATIYLDYDSPKSIQNNFGDL